MGQDPEHPLQQLLAPKRAQIRPETVGFPARSAETPGPKVLGLTQSHMDTLLMRASKTYGRFERGLMPNPPDDFLIAVGKVLQLASDEYTTMWLYARGHRPTQPLDPDDGLVVPMYWQQACDGQRHMMYVTDRAWRVTASNAAFAAMFRSGKVPENTARWMLLSAEARTTLMDWETTWGPSIAAQLRAAYVEHCGNREIAKLHKDVLADEVAGPIYALGVEASIAPDGVARRLNHPLYGPGLAKMVAATPISSPGARAITVIYEPDGD